MFDCQQDEICLREVVAHVASYHTDRSIDFEEINPGIGLRIGKRSSRVWYTAGGYRNSHREESFYAGVGYDVGSAGPFFLKLGLVAITGYEIPIVVGLIPEVGVRFGGYGAAINYAPEVSVDGRTSAEVFTFSISKSF